MASVTVTVPDDQAERIVNAFCAAQNIAPRDLEHGVSVVRDAVFSYLRDRTLLYEAELARSRVLTDADDPLVNAVSE